MITAGGRAARRPVGGIIDDIFERMRVEDETSQEEDYDAEFDEEAEEEDSGAYDAEFGEEVDEEEEEENEVEDAEVYKRMFGISDVPDMDEDVPAPSHGEKWLSHSRFWTSHGEKEASHASRARDDGVPEDDVTVPVLTVEPMWWAKAARNVRWRGSHPARALVFSGGAVVAILTGALAGGSAAAVAAIAAMCLFLALDPIQILARRIAIQTRIIASIGGILIAVFLIWPAVPTLITAVCYAALAAVIIKLCNTQWVVETNYCSSRALYTAFRNNPEETAHRALRGKEQTIFTFWHEMGVPPLDPLKWQLACGTFCLGFLSGLQRGKKDVRSKAEQEVRFARMDLQNAQKDAKEAWKRVELMAKDDKERGFRDQRSADLLIQRAEKIKELEAANEDLMADLANLEKEKKDLEEALSTKDDGAKRKMVWYEVQLGNTSAREISRITGVPKSTVQRWLRQIEEESKAAEDNEGDCLAENVIKIS